MNEKLRYGETADARAIQTAKDERWRAAHDEKPAIILWPARIKTTIDLGGD